MAGLLDIGPLTETVDVNGVPVEVFGVSAKGVLHVISHFPELREMVSGREVDASRLMEMGGEAVAAIIAAGCGLPGNAEAEEVAGRLGVDSQADLLAAILRLTLPKGVGPFVEKLTALAGTISVEQRSATAPAGSSRKRSTNSSAADTPAPTPGP
jgi:hypothetical protein